MAILKQVDGKTFYSVPDEVLDQYAIPADKLGDALKDTGIRLGSSVTAAEIEGKPVGRAQDRPAAQTQSADASAQYLRRTVVACPSCYGSNIITEDTASYRLFQCAFCAYVFRY